MIGYAKRRALGKSRTNTFNRNGEVMASSEPLNCCELRDKGGPANQQVNGIWYIHNIWQSCIVYNMFVCSGRTYASVSEHVCEHWRLVLRTCFVSFIAFCGWQHSYCVLAFQRRCVDLQWRNQPHPTEWMLALLTRSVYPCLWLCVSVSSLSSSSPPSSPTSVNL